MFVGVIAAPPDTVESLALRGSGEVFEQKLDLSSATLPPEAKRFERDVHAELVSKLEDIGNRLLGVVNANTKAVELVLLDALVERGTGEIEKAYRWVLDSWRLRVSLDGEANFVCDLRRQIVIDERRNQAENALGSSHRNGDQVRVAELGHALPSVNTAAQLLQIAAVSHRVEGLAREAKSEGLGHAHHPALPLEEPDSFGEPGRESWHLETQYQHLQICAGNLTQGPAEVTGCERRRSKGRSWG